MKSLCRPIALLIGCLTAAPSSANANPWGPVTVLVQFTPAAARRLAALHESVIVGASWMATPTRAGLSHVNEIGTITLGDEHRRLSGGRAVITGVGLRRDALRWTRGGSVNLNINVWSARLSGPDNILDCTIYDGPAVRLVATTVSLHCALIKPTGR